jgi:hypothetical protein
MTLRVNLARTGAHTPDGATGRPARRAAPDGPNRPQAGPAASHRPAASIASAAPRVHDRSKAEGVARAAARSIAAADPGALGRAHAGLNAARVADLLAS